MSIYKRGQAVRSSLFARPCTTLRFVWALHYRGACYHPSRKKKAKSCSKTLLAIAKIVPLSDQDQLHFPALSLTTRFVLRYTSRAIL